MMARSGSLVARRAAALCWIVLLSGCAGAPEAGDGPLPPDEGAPETTRSAVVEADGWFGFGIGSGDDANLNGRVQGPSGVEFSVPDNFTGGKLELEWEEEGAGDLQLAFWRGDQSTSDAAHHTFYPTSSPFTVDLEADDERLMGVATALVLPGGEGPGAFVRVDWSLQGTFDVPAAGEAA